MVISISKSIALSEVFCSTTVLRYSCLKFMVVPMDLYLQRKFSDYIVACESELEKHGDDINVPTILSNIASAEYELELYRKCIKTCHKVFAVNQNCIRAHFLHLKSLVKLGKDDLCIVLCEGILNRGHGRFESEDVNVILQIQILMESVKSRNSSQLSGHRNTPVELANPIEVNTNSVISAQQDLRVNNADGICSAASNTHNLPVNNNEQGRSNDENITVKNIINVVKNKGENSSSIKNEVLLSVDATKLGRTQSTVNSVAIDSVGGMISNSSGESSSSSTGATNQANTNIPRITAPTSTGVTTKKKTKRSPPVTSGSTESIPSKQVAVTGPTGTNSNSKQSKAQKGTSKSSMDLPSPPVTSSKAAKSSSVGNLVTPTEAVFLRPVKASQVKEEGRTSTALIVPTTRANSTATISKADLERFLSNCLVNEDALVTRTLLKSVRSNLCCAYGEDIVDDMIAFGYLQVNTG